MACYHFAMKKAANVTLPAPKRLAKWMAAIGFDAEVVLTRRETLGSDAPDPDADPGPTDRPVEGRELSSLKASLAAYDVTDKAPSGKRFEPEDDEPEDDE
jgi:hypothetical protein